MNDGQDEGQGGWRLPHGGRKTHGYTGKSEYYTWAAMRRRCYNPNDAAYDHCGGKGIRVCERWNASFDAFLADMGPRPAGHVLTRLDNTKDFSPENCRWADHSVANKARHPAQPPRTCSVDGCARKAKVRGLCGSHYHKLLMQTNPEFAERQRANVRAWGLRNPERKAEIAVAYRVKTAGSERHQNIKRNSSYKRKYGITLEQYDTLLAAQGGCCALCRSPDTKRRDKRFMVDHDHETGVVRGLLCFKCNQALGRFGDNEAGLRRVLAYLLQEGE